MNQAQMMQCLKKVVNGRKVAIRSLVNSRGLQLKCSKVLHETLLMSVLMYGSETLIWKEKKRCRFRPAQMDNLIGFLSIKRMDKGGMWREWRLRGMLKRCT